MIFIKEKSMKNLFELSEEEKNRIRGLHESYKSKPGTSLNEQAARPTGLKVEPGSFDISRTKTSQSGQLSPKDAELPKNDVDYLDPNDVDDVKYAAKLLNNKDSAEYIRVNTFIRKKIKDKKSRTAFDKIIETQPIILVNMGYKLISVVNDDPNNVMVTANRVVIEDLGEKNTVSSEIPAPPPITYPGFNSDSVKESTSNFFADNKWVPTQSMIDYVQKNIVEPVITIYNDAKAQTNQPPVIFLKSLNVNSSVSRFLNSIDNEGNVIPTGENPDRMSFEVLSTKRADASIEYLKTVLKGYVNWDDSVVIKNTKGTNGDGSSGPDPYKEADNLIKSGKFKDYASVFSSPGFRAKYEQYKYTKFNIEIGVVPIPGKTEQPEPIPGTVKTEKNFKFLFFKEDTDWDFTFKLPSISFKYTSSGKTPSFWTFSENDCELKWWQRIFKKYIIPKDF
jgi:hypothetical protein